MGFGQAIKGLTGGRNPAALGRRVFREGALADIDVSETVDLFRISGGEIMLTNMYGKCTAAVTGALTTGPVLTPTDGVATDMSLISATLAAAVVGSIITWNGEIDDALEITGDGIGTPFATGGQILVVGIIGLTTGVVATVGAFDWILHYIPLDPNAYVNAI